MMSYYFLLAYLPHRLNYLPYDAIQVAVYGISSLQVFDRTVAAIENSPPPVVFYYAPSSTSLY